MKSERRHELEQNALADWLGDVLQKIKPYQNAILGALILLLAATIAISMWRTTARQRAAAAWTDYFQAIQTGQPEELEDLISRYPNSQVANWAGTAAGDLRLNAGCELLFTEKSGAMHELRRAIDLYLEVLRHSRERILQERATFGVARAYEAQIDLEQAVQRYEELVQRWPDGPFAEVANERLAALQTRSVRELADRFAKWEPKPAAADLPDFPVSPLEFDLDALPEGPLFTPQTDLGLEGLEERAMPELPADVPAEPIDPAAPEPDAPPTDEPAEPDAAPPAEPDEPVDAPMDEPAEPDAAPPEDPDEAPTNASAQPDADVPADEPAP